MPLMISEQIRNLQPCLFDSVEINFNAGHVADALVEAGEIVVPRSRDSVDRCVATTVLLGWKLTHFQPGYFGLFDFCLLTSRRFRP